MQLKGRQTKQVLREVFFNFQKIFLRISSKTYFNFLCHASTKAETPVLCMYRTYINKQVGTYYLTVSPPYKFFPSHIRYKLHRQRQHGHVWFEDFAITCTSCTAGFCNMYCDGYCIVGRYKNGFTGNINQLRQIITVFRITSPGNNHWDKW